MDTNSKIALEIIKEQEHLIGPLAWIEAKKVTGIVINDTHDLISFNGDAKDIINHLVFQYEKIFGEASIAVCKNAVQDITSKMSPEEIPSILK